MNLSVNKNKQNVLLFKKKMEFIILKTMDE